MTNGPRTLPECQNRCACTVSRLFEQKPSTAPGALARRTNMNMNMARTGTVGWSFAPGTVLGFCSNKRDPVHICFDTPRSGPKRTVGHAPRRDPRTDDFPVCQNLLLRRPAPLPGVSQRRKEAGGAVTTRRLPKRAPWRRSVAP